jgi:hypothetical protein
VIWVGKEREGEMLSDDRKGEEEEGASAFEIVCQKDFSALSVI